MPQPELLDIIKVFVAVATACLGWVIAHFFTSRRDVANAQRAIRNAALAEAYRALVRAGIDGVLIFKDRDGKVVNGAKAVEDAIALIHLYGSKRQSVLASDYAKAVSGGNADLTTLINALREEIRGSLGLPEQEGTPIFLRVAVHGEKNP